MHVLPHLKMTILWRRWTLGAPAFPRLASAPGSRRMSTFIPEGILMLKLKVNGIDRTFDGDPEMPLLWYVRDILALTGTKFGCGMALCGACTVHKNGQAVRSCVTPISAAAASEIRTTENIGTPELHAVQEA